MTLLYNPIGDAPEIPGIGPESSVADKLIAGYKNLVTTPGFLGAGALQRGTVLGQIAATGQFVDCVKTAVDGSAAPCGLLVDDSNASAAAVPCSVYTSGEFNANAISFDASWTLATLQPALRQSGINLKLTSASLSNADPT